MDAGDHRETRRGKKMGEGVSGGESRAGFEGLRFGTALYAFLVMLFLCYKPTTFVQFLEREK
jgi:hypothetical protein